MKRRIAIGETSAFRYIGVEPPLIEDISAQVLGEIAIPAWYTWFKGYHDNNQEAGRVATEFWFDVSDAVDAFGSRVVDKTSLEVAHQIARMLRSLGDEVELSEEIIAIDFQHPLFGEYAEETREYIRSLNSRQPSS